jgi:hypothetical protein
VNAGDFNPPEKWVVNTIAYAIRQHDPSALHTAHCGPETIASTYWTNEDWLDFDTLYTYLPVHIQARETYKSFKKTPTILFESAYEFEHSADEHRIRMQAYQALLTGASGHFFGNNPIWHFDGPGTFQSDINWREALNSRGTQSMTHLVNIFRRLEWWKLIPDLDGTLITDDRGADETYTVGAISNDGKFSMIYIPDERNLKLDLTGMKGPNIEQRWYDPSLGAFVDMKRIDKLTRSKHEVVTPGKNHVGDTDWILLLESTEH